MYTADLMNSIAKAIMQECSQNYKFYNKPIMMYKDIYGFYYIIFTSNNGYEVILESRRVASNPISAFIQKTKYRFIS
jgi:hypothetical protein